MTLKQLEAHAEHLRWEVKIHRQRLKAAVADLKEVDEEITKLVFQEKQINDKSEKK